MTELFLSCKMIIVIALQKPVRSATGGEPEGSPLFFFKRRIRYAKEILKQTSYYSLIGGYKDIFKNRITKKYRDGTNFEDIVELYYFDEKLRQLFLHYLIKVENEIKSLVSYYFTEEHGESQQEYLDVNNYMYMLLPQNIQIKVSRNYSYINEKQLGQILRILVKYRNVCAHGERLFTYKTIDSIPDLPLHMKMNLLKKGNQYLYGKNDLFAIVLSLRYLLSDQWYKELKKELVRLIQKYLKGHDSISEDELLEKMGFPKNWKNVTRYRKNKCILRNRK